MNCISYISHLSNKLTQATGSVWAVIFSILSTVIFITLGFFLHWSSIFLLVFNTFLSVLSYLILFILQHSSNKDQVAIQKKLDELIRATDKASNSLIELEKQE